MTSGAYYGISVRPRISPDGRRRSVVRIEVDLPFEVTEEEPLTDNLHNAVELALAPLFVGRDDQAADTDASASERDK